MHQIVGVDLNTRLFPSSNHPEGNPKPPEDARLTEKLLQLFLFNKTSASFSGYSSKVSKIPSGSLIWTLTI
jgi:hypothetical protein